MLHQIPDQKYGPLGAPMTRAVEACVHCGFCLAACPTYRELGQEMDTPRGRIVLMKQVLEGNLSWTEAQPHIDRCLGCLACEPACPSGVPYRDLISPFRAIGKAEFKQSKSQRLRQWLAAQTIPFPGRFRMAMRAGRLMRPFAALAPRALRPMLELVPEAVSQAPDWPAFTPAAGPRRARVALLLGCAQQVLMPEINTAAIEVLAHNGVEVHVPRGQGCCGGLAWHTGDLGAARRFARQNLAAFPADVDAIITTAAGCGTAMHEYHLILRGTPEETKANEFRKRVVDISQFLVRLGMRAIPAGTVPVRPLRVAYHDACHLANGQNVRAEPRTLLQSIPGLQLCEISGAELCCGSAGTYNLDQPKIAASLGEKKARAVMDTGASMVATGNIGCAVQLQAHLAKLGSPVKVAHTIQLLRDAYSRR